MTRAALALAALLALSGCGNWPCPDDQPPRSTTNTYGFCD